MPSLERGSNRIVIAGASSLLGAELRSLLEESRFAGAEFRLVDEEIAAGTLTEAGGEPAVIRPVEEGTFDRAGKVFFTGSAEFTRANLAAARASGAKIIDLSGATADDEGTVSWFPKLDALHGRKFPNDADVYAIPSAARNCSRFAGVGPVQDWRIESGGDLFPVRIRSRARGYRRTGEPDRTTCCPFKGWDSPCLTRRWRLICSTGLVLRSKQKLNAVRERLRAETMACVGKQVGDACVASDPCSGVLWDGVFGVRGACGWERRLSRSLRPARTPDL